jgi:hypothetical protein
MKFGIQTILATLFTFGMKGRKGRRGSVLISSVVYDRGLLTS